MCLKVGSLKYIAGAQTPSIAKELDWRDVII